MTSAGKDSQMEICPDGHHCLNGSKCTENPYDEGSFYCDCEEYVFEVRYEGLYCEHKAEVYCIENGSSTNLFCTNGGVCVKYEGAQESYIGCKCPEEYEGTHCQFVRGTKPKGWPFTTTSQLSPPEKRNTTNVGAIAGSLIFAMTLVIIGVAFAYKRYYFRKEHYDQMDSRQLQEHQYDDAMEGVENVESNNHDRVSPIKEDNGIV